MYVVCTLSLCYVYWSLYGATVTPLKDVLLSSLCKRRCKFMQNSGANKFELDLTALSLLAGGCCVKTECPLSGGDWDLTVPCSVQECAWLWVCYGKGGILRELRVIPWPCPTSLGNLG
jgi:hypothetical protein